MEYVYAALLLHKLGKSVDEAGIKSVLKASGAAVDEAKVKSLLASLDGVDIDSELANAVAVSTAAPAADAKSEEAPKEEKKTEEESAAGLSALFG